VGESSLCLAVGLEEVVVEGAVRAGGLVMSCEADDAGVDVVRVDVVGKVVVVVVVVVVLSDVVVAPWRC
jgi:hypothetical protein